MNASTTRGQARIQQHDLAAVHRANRFMVGTALVALERQRTCQAEAEVDWLLKQHGVTPQASASLVSLLRRTIGAALIRAGDRLVGIPPGGVSSETAPVAGRQGTAA